MDAPDILVLYNEHEPGTTEIVQRIRDKGYKVFFWKDDVEIGAAVQGSEEAVLAVAKHVLVFLGSLGWGLNHLRLTELAIQRKNNLVIPVLIGDASVSEEVKASGLFIDRRYVDLRERHVSDFEKLFNRLGRVEEIANPSLFEELLANFLSGDKEVRNKIFDITESYNKFHKQGLTSAIHAEIDRLDKIEKSATMTEEAWEHLQSLRSWLISLLIKVDSEGGTTKDLVLHRLHPDVEPNADRRFWILAGLYLTKSSYLHLAAELAFTGNEDAPNALASMIMAEGKLDISSFRAFLKDEDIACNHVVLKVLSVFPVPALLEDVIVLLKEPKIRYDVLLALANPGHKSELKLVSIYYSANQILSFIHSVSERMPKFAVEKVSRILKAFPDEEVEEALRGFPPGAGSFIGKVRNGLGNTIMEDESSTLIAAGFTPDQMDVRFDLMDIRKDVATLSALMLSRKIDPPLAIGLFGKWGTGKSFFMDSLEAQCNLMIGQSGTDKMEAFHSDVVQIRFNAWNYSDSNLWASLVHHIFENLSHFVTPPQTEKQKLSDFAEIIKEKTASAAEVEKTLAKREQELELKHAELKRREDERLNSNIKLTELKLEDYWDILNAEQKADAKKLMKDFGVDELHTSLVQMQGVIREAKSVGGQISGIFAWVLNKKNRTLRILLLAGIFLFFPALGYLLETQWPGFLKSLAGTIFHLAGFISAVAVAGYKGLNYLKRGLSAVEQVKDNIDSVFKAKRATPSDAEEELKTEIAKLDKAQEVSKTELDTLKQQLEETLKEEKDYKEKISLGYFVAERSLSEDYRKHLGLVTTIRKDFKTLIDRLSQEQDIIHGRKVTRIILYIDDLDRCQPDKVFEVLQAVNLLLAYKLFVVVVGVDPDWMTTSLKSTYSQFRDAGEQVTQLNPQHFIEKIFQIPFYLKPLSSTGFPSLMKGLFHVDISSNEPTESLTYSPGDHSSSLANTGLESIADNETVDTLIMSGTTIPTAVIDDVGAGNLTGTNLTVSEDMVEVAEAMEIQVWETSFAGKLFPFIGTPRSAKRFVNIYRLLKVGLNRKDIETFEGTSYHLGEFQLPMLLLAIVVGCPTFSNVILRHLYQGAKIKKSISVLVEERESLSVKDRELSKLMDEMKKLVANPIFPGDAELMERWIPEVARFSFKPIDLD